MQPKTKWRVWTGLSALCGILALLGSGVAVYLVHMGAYPPPGESSLGHVGIVVAGLAAGFLGIVLGLFALYTGLRAREQRPFFETRK